MSKHGKFGSMRARGRYIASSVVATALIAPMLGVPTASAAPIAYSNNGGSVSISDLNSQLFWADFSPANITGKGLTTFAGQANAFQIGSVYEKEVTPGYVVRAEVIELKPLGYDKNVNFDRPTKGVENDVAVIARGDDTNYSHLYKAGLPAAGLSGIGSKPDGGNVGIKFRVTATMNGTPVLPTVIVADAEEASGEEAQRYTTSGTPWSLVAEVKRNETNPSFRDKDATLSGHWVTASGHQWDKNDWLNNSDPNRGIGTQTVGTMVTQLDNGSVPIVATQAKDVSGGVDVGIYINSRGAQFARFGFLIPDYGDAPESYGTAAHMILARANYTHPSLGSTAADAMFNPQEKDWETDDYQGGLDVADEGLAQLSGDGTEAGLGYFDAAAGRATLKMLANASSLGTSFVKTWVDSNNDGTFDNGLGSEASQLFSVNGAGKTVTPIFNGHTQIVDTSIEKVGVRVRIADVASEIEGPTGYATTGEVEDFLLRVVHPPRGSKGETTGVQGATQTWTPKFQAFGKQNSDLTTANAIVANSYKLVAADGTLTDEVTVAEEGTYTIDTATGVVTFKPLSTFTGTAKGVAIRATDDNGNTTGWTAETAVNGLENINQLDGRQTMDALFVPTVTAVVPTVEPVKSTGKQGEEQFGTPEFKNGDGTTLTPDPVNNPAKLIDPQTGEPTDSTTVDAYGINPKTGEREKVGTYTVDPATGKVTFTPNKDFYGTPEPAGVQIKDSNGTPVTANYQPVVTPVVPVGQGVGSAGVQGEKQTGTPVFTNGDGTPLTPDADNGRPAKLVDPETGKPTDETTIPAKDASGKQVGTYTIDPKTGEVTFTPNDDFVGTPEPVFVAVTDNNGSEARAAYQPKVIARPSSSAGAVSSGSQGEKQNGTPTFTDGDGNPLEPSATNPAKLIDPQTGKVTDEPTVDAYGINPKTGQEEVIGTYTIDPLTGEVTFTPNPDFYGSPKPATVQLIGSNDTPVTAQYQPVVNPLLPVGNGAASIGQQGQKQDGTPTFNNGDGTELAPSATNPATLIDPATGKPTDATEVDAFAINPDTGVREVVGKYSIDPVTGKVTFTPNPDFVGEPLPAIVQVKDAMGNGVRAAYQPKVVSTATVPAAPADNSSKRCVANAFALNSPLMWLLPLGLIAAIGAPLSEHLGRVTAQINADLENTAFGQMMRRVREQSDEFSRGLSSGNNGNTANNGAGESEWARTMRGQFDAIGQNLGRLASENEGAVKVIAAIGIGAVLVGMTAQACKPEGFAGWDGSAR